MRNKAILAILMCFTLSSCALFAKPEPEIVYVEKKVSLAHPSMPTPPDDPGVKIRVITTDTIKQDRAYVGFEYDVWLEFAQWMHTYKAHQSDLLEVIRLYKEQDETLYPVVEKEIEKN
ncbi:membrane lipoprotein [Vibrio phage 1.081.O._10N.286.52.C2]|nr:membrane lipoprotein [Vibrio phage 1.081.O._10N.286.52.C2]